MLLLMIAVSQLPGESLSSSCRVCMVVPTGQRSRRKQEISGDDSPTRWVAFVHPYWVCATVCEGIACRQSHVVRKRYFFRCRLPSPVLYLVMMLMYVLTFIRVHAT